MFALSGSYAEFRISLAVHSLAGATSKIFGLTTCCLERSSVVVSKFSTAWRKEDTPKSAAGVNKLDHVPPPRRVCVLKKIALASPAVLEVPLYAS